MNKNMLETLTGAFVLIIAGWFLLFFMKNNTGLSVANDQYSLFAKFNQADGISVGTPVKIIGVKVGVITADYIDLDSYFAVVNFSVDNKIKIPADSTAKISSEGLIGGKYLAIVPGGDDKMLANGEEVRFTQSSINLETLIGKMMFSKSDSENKEEK